MGISEKIFVQFVIDKAGRITNSLVVRGEDKHLKEEALRLVNSIPKLIAAKQRGVNLFLVVLRCLLILNYNKQKTH